MKIAHSILVILATLALVACGSDGGKVVSGDITGVAATGHAISGGIVTLRCAGGLDSATTTTSGDGSYRFTVKNITLPCLAKVDFSDSHGNPRSLHGYVAATGTVNITPLTELMTAALLGYLPATAFANPADMNTPDAAGITAARSRLSNLLRELGWGGHDDIDPMSSPLVAQNHEQEGNYHDNLLEGLQALIAYRNITLEQLANAAASRSPLFDSSNIDLAQDVQTFSLEGSHWGSLPSYGAHRDCSFTVHRDGSISTGLTSGDPPPFTGGVIFTQPGSFPAAEFAMPFEIAASDFTGVGDVYGNRTWNYRIETGGNSYTAELTRLYGLIFSDVNGHLNSSGQYIHEKSAAVFTQLSLVIRKTSPDSTWKQTCSGSLERTDAP